MASSVKHVCTKNYYNLPILFQVTIDNVRDVFYVSLFISTHISLAVFSPGSAKTDIEGGGMWNSHLLASCARNICTKNY